MRAGFGVRAVLILWGGIMLLIGASLMARHEIALPAPEPPAIRARLDLLLTPEDQGRMVAVHVLSMSCRCSRQVLTHLIESERPAGLREVALLIGEAPLESARLRAKGFEVRTLTPEALSSWYGIESSPLLLITGVDGAVRYSGGYTESKQSLDIRDLSLLAQVKEGEPTNELPVLGCAVSPELKAAIDPLGVLR
jgi:hypothetical protein